ncbi:MAG: hypothetical protein M3Q14_00620 [bacterium]|nr:hypothetical protein [bacterium]
MQHHILSFSGIAGIAILWLSVITSLILTRFNVLGTLPISYLGVYDNSRYLFNGGLILSALLLLLFMCHVGRQIILSKVFLAVFFLGQLSQIIVALTAYNSQSIEKTIHVIFAFALALTLPVSMYAFKKSPGVTGNIKLMTSRLLNIELVMFVLGIGWFVRASAAGALSEMIVAVVFDVWIIVLSLKLLQADKLRAN